MGAACRSSSRDHLPISYITEHGINFPRTQPRMSTDTLIGLLGGKAVVLHHLHNTYSPFTGGLLDHARRQPVKGHMGPIPCEYRFCFLFVFRRLGFKLSYSLL